MSTTALHLTTLSAKSSNKLDKSKNEVIGRLNTRFLMLGLQLITPASHVLTLLVMDMS